MSGQAPDRNFDWPKQTSRSYRRMTRSSLSTKQFNWTMTRHEWSQTERGMALGLRSATRLPLREIANFINIPKSTIHDINKRGTGINKPRTGRPPKLSSRDIRQIIRYIRTNKSTRRTTLTRLKQIFHLKVHENTIRNALTQAGYHRRIARRRPYLNTHDREWRLKFAREHKD